MFDDEWILIDTETTGFAKPISVVELAAQRMKGWEPSGPHFRRLLNQNKHIPPEASRVHGYTREILERDGEPPEKVYADFRDYVGGKPIVAYNLVYDMDRVLLPEFERFNFEPFGLDGFCALKLAQRLLDPVPAGNCKLQTLRQFYRLPERGAHTGLGDVETVVDLMQDVLRPIAEERNIQSFDAIKSYTEQTWFPSRLPFGKYKGRDFRDAAGDDRFRGWLEWLSSSSNANSSAMGDWYLDELDRGEGDALAPDFTEDDGAQNTEKEGSSDPAPKQTESAATSETSTRDISVFRDAELDEIVLKIGFARERLAELEAEYTGEVKHVDWIQSAIFIRVRKQYQRRDRLRLLVQFRQEYLDRLLVEGEEQAEEVGREYDQAQKETDSNYEEASASADEKKEMSDGDRKQMNDTWKKLVKLFHPDKFSNDPEKQAAYENLVKAVNKARDDGDISMLEEIAADPKGFMARNGWMTLEFGDSAELENQRRLYESLQIQIVAIIEQLNELRETSEYELASLCRDDPGLVDRIAEERIEVLASESAELLTQAGELGEQITELTDAPPNF
jgi:DNA polymerase III epsilon subunit-like protein